VAGALFREWERELEEYSDPTLKRRSRSQLDDTRARYDQLVRAMDRAAASMDPVLAMLRDQTLFLKHNLNARALGSLSGTADQLQSDVARQTGSDPRRAFEVSLGRVTLALARQAVGPAADGSLPLEGLARFELAVYDVPPAGRELDFTRMAVHGWEPTVRARTPSGSTLVLVRSAGGALGDVVLVTADADRALYARLAGRLSNDLPAALGRAVTERGTDGVRRELMSLTGTRSPE